MQIFSSLYYMTVTVKISQGKSTEIPLRNACISLHQMRPELIRPGSLQHLILSEGNSCNTVRHILLGLAVSQAVRV